LSSLLCCPTCRLPAKTAGSLRQCCQTADIHGEARVSGSLECTPPQTSPPLAIQSTGGCRAPDRPPRVPLSLPSISPDGRLLLSHATYPSLQTVPETLDHTPHIISTVPVPHHAHVLCCTPQISFHRRHKSYRDDPRTRGYAKVIQNTRFALAPASQPKTSSDPSQGTAGGKGCMNGSSML
jgi:hypothetical protein